MFPSFSVCSNWFSDTSALINPPRSVLYILDQVPCSKVARWAIVEQIVHYHKLTIISHRLWFIFWCKYVNFWCNLLLAPSRDGRVGSKGERVTWGMGEINQWLRYSHCCTATPECLSVCWLYTKWITQTVCDVLKESCICGRESITDTTVSSSRVPVCHKRHEEQNQTTCLLFQEREQKQKLLDPNPVRVSQRFSQNHIKHEERVSVCLCYAF